MREGSFLREKCVCVWGRGGGAMSDAAWFHPFFVSKPGHFGIRKALYSHPYSTSLSRYVALGKDLPSSGPQFSGV